MKWKKLGRVFSASGQAPWMLSHAYLPTAYQIESDRIRVFLAFRDEANVGRIGWIDVAAENPMRVVALSEQPALDVGRPGAFDDNGVTPLSVVRDGDCLRMYYAGWQLTPRARYLLFTGLALSHDGGRSFVRYQETPVLDRSPSEFVIRSGAGVIKDPESDIWKVWYAAGSSLVDISGKAVPSYNLVYAESEDGIVWPSTGTVALMPQGPDEYGFGRPHVWRKGERYEMWYSVRSHSKNYQIGYATSRSGLDWERRDAEGGLPRSEAGWDADMTCFASLIENEHGCFMFYNGNGYGSTGVGVAQRID